MTITMIMATLVVGLIMLILGFIVKNKWLKILAAVPLAIFIFQLGRLVGFLIH